MSQVSPGQVTAAELHITQAVALDNEPLRASDSVDLLWSCLAMGFTWSLYVCQRSAETRLTEQPSLQGSLLLRADGPTLQAWLSSLRQRG